MPSLTAANSKFLDEQRQLGVRREQCDDDHIMNIQRTCRSYRWIGAAWLRNARSYSEHLHKPSQNREVYRRPVLRDENNIVQNGYEGLMSPDGVQKAWFQYQDFLLERVKYDVIDTPLESTSVSALVATLARDAGKAALFNYASMAYNNHFFFRGLTTQARSVSIPGPLREDLVDAFGSLSTLRSLMLDTAMSMFGPGFVWLVQRRDRNSMKGKSFAVMNTYIAGSPLPAAYRRKQSVDLNSQASKDKALLESAMENTALPYSKDSVFQNRVNQTLNPPGGVIVHPVLCVNTWEHAWMFDWGVAGKEKYLESWWDCIDWNVVDATRHRSP